MAVNMCARVCVFVIFIYASFVGFYALFTCYLGPILYTHAHTQFSLAAFESYASIQAHINIETNTCKYTYIHLTCTWYVGFCCLCLHMWIKMPIGILIFLLRYFDLAIEHLSSFIYSYTRVLKNTDIQNLRTLPSTEPVYCLFRVRATCTI